MSTSAAFCSNPCDFHSVSGDSEPEAGSGCSVTVSCGDDSWEMLWLLPALGSNVRLLHDSLQQHTCHTLLSHLYRTTLARLALLLADTAPHFSINKSRNINYNHCIITMIRRFKQILHLFRRFAMSNSTKLELALPRLNNSHSVNILEQTTRVKYKSVISRVL